MHYTSLKELFQKNYKLTDKPTPFAGYYGVDARLMLMIARRENFAGAKEAYQYLYPKLAVVPHTHNVPDLANRSGWAIAYDDEN